MSLVCRCPCCRRNCGGRALCSEGFRGLVAQRFGERFLVDDELSPVLAAFGEDGKALRASGIASMRSMQFWRLTGSRGKVIDSLGNVRRSCRAAGRVRWQAMSCRSGRRVPTPGVGLGLRQVTWCAGESQLSMVGLGCRFDVRSSALPAGLRRLLTWGDSWVSAVTAVVNRLSSS